MIQPITGAEKVNEVISGGNVIIGVSAPWCGYCRRLRPIFVISCPAARQSFSTELRIAGMDFLWEIIKVMSISKGSCRKIRIPFPYPAAALRK